MVTEKDPGRRFSAISNYDLIFITERQFKKAIKACNLNKLTHNEAVYIPRILLEKGFPRVKISPMKK
ncbi:hypothetical protein HRM2_23470 [Desulforapulum autotrophicum HRM2]|uniref:Uncharacterized protein n=1 Tax=Desulforapulum autotrophicum (strain ATCC 43914 / DSM 3382 / VKM B-1955 / HRM2) TaxID=177437 RepID=C0QEV0_DESAH|nr:hypothetical protein [Desulforapulum autotrophicum]ACN15442.1 hypothetical protein HRM2_23470 [Desulforapulum autotrophicum HRM2]